MTYALRIGPAGFPTHMYHVKLYPTKMNGAGKELESSGFENKNLLPSVLEAPGGTE